MGAFRYFKHFNLSVDSTFTIDGFSESKVYMVIGCHRYQQGGIYLIACGYGINLELKLICGIGYLQTLSSTSNTITVKALSVSSSIVLEIGYWG